MVKQLIFAALLTLALWTAGGALAQSNYGTTNSSMTTTPTVTDTVTPSPTTTGVQPGQGGGPGTTSTMPNAPVTGGGACSAGACGE